MNIEWLVKIKWAGNLQNVPLPANTRIHDYQQIEPGLIVVDILCGDYLDLSILVVEVTHHNWCSEIHATPHFKEVCKLCGT